MTDESSIPEQLRDYNWQEAFGFASPSAVAGYSASTEPFDVADVAEVIAAEDGYSDGDHWIGVFRLKDGRYASLSAWCDYTGWDCRSGGSARVAATREDIIRYGLTHGERQRLGLLLPGEENTTGGES